MGLAGEQPHSGRMAGRIGHYSHLMLSAAIVGVILIGLYPPSGPAMLTLPLALLVFVLACWVVMRQHDRALCERCLAAMPLNPAELATRYRARFWLAHSGAHPRFLFPYLAVLIGSNFAPGTAGRIAWAVIQSSMIYLIMAHTTHRRLQPWCPWCRGGGGRDKDDATPPPPPSDRHLLV